jgi:hypothetical protein
MSRIHRRRKHHGRPSNFKTHLPKDRVGAAAIATKNSTPDLVANCLVCSLGTYQPQLPDCCLKPTEIQAIHADLMRAGRRALGSEIYRPLEQAYTFAAAAA